MANDHPGCVFLGQAHLLLETSLVEVKPVNLNTVTSCRPGRVVKEEVLKDGPAILAILNT